MKIFISWSGERSKAVAEILCEWIQLVLQSSKPWISSNGIERGALWFNNIMDELADTKIGVFCLTRENKDRPWILFEAGAVTKGQDVARVCTLLIDLPSTELEPPLSQFNYSSVTPEDMWKLIFTLNSHMAESSLKETILKEVFDTYWPKFDAKFKEAISKTESQATPPSRTQDEILREILMGTRSIERAMRNLSHRDLPTKGDELFPTFRSAKRLAVRIAATEGLSNMKEGLEKAGYSPFIASMAVRQLLKELNDAANQPELSFKDGSELTEPEQP